MSAVVGIIAMTRTEAEFMQSKITAPVFNARVQWALDSTDKSENEIQLEVSQTEVEFIQLVCNCFPKELDGVYRRK